MLMNFECYIIQILFNIMKLLCVKRDNDIIYFVLGFNKFPSKYVASSGYYRHHFYVFQLVVKEHFSDMQLLHVCTNTILVQTFSRNVYICRACCLNEFEHERGGLICLQTLLSIFDRCMVVHLKYTNTLLLIN